MAMISPILEERVTAVGRVPRQIMGRTGALFVVAQQAAAVEPLIAEFWQQGRKQSCHAQRLIWTKAAGDGLLPPGTDLEWLIVTAGLLAAAETYLLSTRVTTWDLDDYEGWIRTTLTRLLLETASPG
jgi:hypothetical protein